MKNNFDDFDLYPKKNKLRTYKSKRLSFGELDNPVQDKFYYKSDKKRDKREYHL